ncbi:MAG: hypothetical protein JM58_09405 [Peptococcaceae bacterium BICA1-8]|nr:MAG: hypothetical protein JM58_09405 [Peptococcaceae bacterium BICA1-8]
MTKVIDFEKHKRTISLPICDMCEKNGKDCLPNAEICLPLEMLRQLCKEHKWKTKLEMIDNIAPLFCDIRL